MVDDASDLMSSPKFSRNDSQCRSLFILVETDKAGQFQWIIWDRISICSCYWDSRGALKWGELGWTSDGQLVAPCLCSWSVQLITLWTDLVPVGFFLKTWEFTSLSTDNPSVQKDKKFNLPKMISYLMVKALFKKKRWQKIGKVQRNAWHPSKIYLLK